MRKLIFILPLALIFARCSNPYQGKISEIDSLLVLMDSAKMVMNKLDTGLIFERRLSVRNNVNLIAALKDSLSKDDVIFLDQYSAYYKTYNKWGLKVNSLYDECHVIPMQLSNLRNDMAKKLIEPEKAEQYFSIEKQNSLTVFNMVMQLDEGLKSINGPFLLTEEKVILLIQRLESEKHDEI